MLQSIKGLFTKHLFLKFLSLMLALLVWFYIVNELNKGSNEEMALLKKMRPGEGMVAKKLMINPVFVGKPSWGNIVRRDQVVVVPDYCVVMGTKDTLIKVSSANTMPIDLKRVSKTFIAQVALSPIAPGVYMEDTPVQVTVPIEKSESSQNQLL
jgi:YbbR domain-containing protein